MTRLQMTDRGAARLREYGVLRPGAVFATNSALPKGGALAHDRDGRLYFLLHRREGVDGDIVVYPSPDHDCAIVGLDRASSIKLSQNNVQANTLSVLGMMAVGLDEAILDKSMQADSLRGRLEAACVVIGIARERLSEWGLKPALGWMGRDVESGSLTHDKDGDLWIIWPNRGYRIIRDARSVETANGPGADKLATESAWVQREFAVGLDDAACDAACDALLARCKAGGPLGPVIEQELTRIAAAKVTAATVTATPATAVMSPKDSLLLRRAALPEHAILAAAAAAAPPAAPPTTQAAIAEVASLDSDDIAARFVTVVNLFADNDVLSVDTVNNWVTTGRMTSQWMPRSYQQVYVWGLLQLKLVGTMMSGNGDFGLAAAVRRAVLHRFMAHAGVLARRLLGGVRVEDLCVWIGDLAVPNPRRWLSQRDIIVNSPDGVICVQFTHAGGWVGCNTHVLRGPSPSALQGGDGSIDSARLWCDDDSDAVLVTHNNRPLSGARVWSARAPAVAGIIWRPAREGSHVGESHRHMWRVRAAAALRQRKVAAWIPPWMPEVGERLDVSDGARALDMPASKPIDEVIITVSGSNLFTTVCSGKSA